MPRALTVLGSCCTVLALAVPPAQASWSEPQTFAAPYLDPPLAVATNGAGESVVAWAARRRIAGVKFRGSVSVTVRDAAGRLHIRKLWESRRTDVTHVAAVIDRRDRITVVWVVRGDDRGRPNYLHAAYRATNGRWSATAAVGIADRTPRLAAAPNGDVLVAFNGSFGTPGRQAPAIAWRAPGRPFGAVRRLTPTSATSVVSRGSEPEVAFDARGTAYAWDGCAAWVLRAPPGHHVFGRPTVLGPRGRSFNLAVRGAGDGLATWVDGGCSGGVEDPGRAGPVRASVLRAGAFEDPVTLTPADEQAAQVGAVALPGGRGSLNWSSYDESAGSTKLFSARLLAGGAFGATHDATGEYVAVAADAQGDELLEPVGSAVEDRTFNLRPSGGGADEPATRDMLGETARYAVATPSGRGAALGWLTTFRSTAKQRVGMTVWRP